MTRAQITFLNKVFIELKVSFSDNIQMNNSADLQKLKKS